MSNVAPAPECGICMMEMPRKKMVPCTRCVNGVCITCFRTMATSTNKTDVECPYCKIAFTTTHVESLLTKAQIEVRRVNVQIKRECEYIQVTYDYISEMINLCALTTTLHNVHMRMTAIRMQLFQLTLQCSPETTESRVGISNRLNNDLANFTRRSTCISTHIAQIISSSNLPDMLVEDCVSNVFELCSSDTRLSAYDSSPDLKELLTIGLLLSDRHVVRPNAFQHGAVRIESMRASHTINQLVKIIGIKCKQSLKIREFYDDMCAAMEQDMVNNHNPNQMTAVAMFLDKMALSTKKPREFKTWLSLYAQWRVNSTNNLT